MHKAQRLRSCFLTLDAYGCSIDDTLAALHALRDDGSIVLHFTPQASDTVLEAQVADVLARMAPMGKEHEFLAFISHHKSDAGDAARIFVDAARRVLEQRGVGMSAAAAANTAASGGGGKLPKLFLDVNELTYLQNLLTHVGSSANHVLLLSRASLERPYVLCELVAAWCSLAGRTDGHLAACAPWPSPHAACRLIVVSRSLARPVAEQEGQEEAGAARAH